MMSLRTPHHVLRRALTVGAAGALSLVATAAIAGECPADKMAADSMKPGASEPKGVADKELGSVDLAAEMVKADGRRLRLRRLEIQPGGVVPWHSHADRPALIYIVSGTITEYASDCAVPIVHKTGELSREHGGLSHWWKNTGKTVVVLLSADIVHDAMDKDAKQM